MTEARTSVSAPAKINLTLAVLGGPGPDGYHQLRGVVARLGLADELMLEGIGPPDERDRLNVEPPPTDRSHEADIVLRATAALRAWAGRPLPRLELRLRKRIPVAAGLGGGSSDGAAALRLASAAWGLPVPEDELRAVAADLGADVPFFLAGTALALVSGRGERVEALPSVATAGTGVLLVTRPGKPSTGEVFAAFDARPRRGASTALAATERLATSLREGGAAGRLVDLAGDWRDANDLYPAAAVVMPWLEKWRGRVEAALARPALLSGAGPTLAVLYASAAEARRARRVLAEALGPATHATAAITATVIDGDRGRA